MSEDPSAYEPARQQGLEPAELELRRLAKKRLDERRGLQAHLLSYLLVNGFLFTIWAVTGGGFFWPLFPMFGWGIGLAFHIWAFMSPEPSEERIRAEMRRIAGQG